MWWFRWVEMMARRRHSAVAVATQRGKGERRGLEERRRHGGVGERR